MTVGWLVWGVLLVSETSPLIDDPPPSELTVGVIEVQGLTATDPRVVRRELLITSRRPYDAALVEESRKRVAALPFVKRVQLTIGRVDRVVHITLTIAEQATWYVTPYSSGGLGNVTVGTRVGEPNMFGKGWALSTDYSYNTYKRHYGSASLFDPYLIPDTHVSGKIDAGVGQDGFVAGGTVWRPPRWEGQEWVFEAGGKFQQDIVRVFDNGVVTGEYKADATTFPLRVGRAWVDVNTHYLLSVGTRYERAQFVSSATLPTVTPGSRDRLILMADAQVSTDLAVKDTWYNRLGEEEEIPLGTRSYLGWEHASASILSDITYHAFRIGQTQDYRLRGLGYLFFTVGVEGRMESRDLTNLTANLQGKLAFRTLPEGFLVGRMVVDALLKNENRAQLFLGSDTGLRGFSINRFSGEKRWYLNMEQRSLLFHAGPIDVGGVAFCDMGTVYKESDLMDPRLWNTAFGVGVRIASQTISFPMGRLDVGYGVTDGLFALSLGTNQYF